jgi:hypothetical protein
LLAIVVDHRRRPPPPLLPPLPPLRIIMGKEPKRNPMTGCIRRGVKRDQSAYRRALHLSIKEVGLRDLIQRTMVSEAVAAAALMTSVAATGNDDGDGDNDGDNNQQSTKAAAKKRRRRH